MAEAAAHERQVFRTKQQTAVENVKKAGVEMTPIDEKAFVDAVRPAWDKWARDLKAEKLLEQILAIREG
jgi:TRAP-type C4-dicarboxylate transport system substrate-binding protein